MNIKFFVITQLKDNNIRFFGGEKTIIFVVSLRNNEGEKTIIIVIRNQPPYKTEVFSVVYMVADFCHFVISNNDNYCIFAFVRPYFAAKRRRLSSFICNRLIMTFLAGATKDLMEKT